MKIVMMGSGGVGGFFGGRLAHAGFDVSFIARGAHLAAMRERGLRIENQPQGNIHVPNVRVVEDPAALAPVDLVILSVKLWDTEAAARAIRPLVGPGTGVLSLQKHRHRAEHWIVVRGTAEVSIGDQVRAVHENESVYIPIGSVHRMANRGKIALELIEVQTGSYLGEDDIERIEDVYKRT